MDVQAKLTLEQRPSQRNQALKRIDHSIHVTRADFYFRHLRPWVNAGESLLDVGGGDGMLASRFARTNPQVRAVDVEARSLSGFEVEVYNGKQIPAADAGVDVTTCVTVLHHCDDADAVLREIRRVTRKRFLLVDDRFDSWLDRVCVIGFHHYLRWIESMPFDPKGFRHTAQWRQRLAAAGFRVVKTITLGRPLAVFPVVNTLFVAETV